LQRNLLDISIPVDQGPWVGMEAYLRDDAFKTNRPKLIIWEIPEREMRSPPNYKYRDARYVIDNTEWLSRIAALLK
jgi:alginate O-acetyltransferase complex protein AlgJ